MTMETNNPNTILLLESGDLEVYQGKDPRRYYHSGYQNEGPEVLHEWLSTKRIVKMAQGEKRKLAEHLDNTGKFPIDFPVMSPIDVSDIVEILPDKKISHGKFAKNIDMLGYFNEPVRELPKLDLYTLERIKFLFDIQSDHSSSCSGYEALLKTIESINRK